MSIPSIDASVPPAGQAPPPQPPSIAIGRFAVERGLPRSVLFLLFVIVSLCVFHRPLATLVHYALVQGGHQYDKYSHILLIPFVALALVFIERARIFASVQYSFRLGAILLLVGVAVAGWGHWAANALGVENALSVEILALVILWIAAFILCYGTRAWRAGAFPLLFLLFAVPIPNPVLEVPLSVVRYGSTEICSLIFSVAGVPFLQNGFEFALSSLTIEVAKECSGIHSTLALFIVSLIAGHFFLASVGRKALLILFVLPIVCISNGLRIAGLTLLSVYVDPRFMYSSLHREGGVGFFLLGLFLLFGTLRLLQIGTKRKTVAGKTSGSG